ncbi:MAG: hypothetical protein H6839_13600 [Planctomycetes bacterium]|nr:hypothetical protein [Planctomycetota bacterium]
MTQPYLESGKTAERLLQEQPVADRTERRLRANLRGYKQVINVIGVFGIALTPLVGVMTRSSVNAALVALNFLVVIVVLELMERRVKHSLHEHLDKRRPDEDVDEAADKAAAEAAF